MFFLDDGFSDKLLKPVNWTNPNKIGQNRTTLKKRRDSILCFMIFRIDHCEKALQ